MVSDICWGFTIKECRNVSRSDFLGLYPVELCPVEFSPWGVSPVGLHHVGFCPDTIWSYRHALCT